MKIGINCLNLYPDYRGGINTYALGLISGFAEIDKSNSYIIFCTTKNEFLFDKFKSCENVKIIPFNYSDIYVFVKKFLLRIAVYCNSKMLFKTSVNFLFKKNVLKKISQHTDILYIPSTTLDYFNYKLPTVISMHDIQFAHFPEFFTKFQVRYSEFDYGLSAKYTSYFQSSSNFIKDDIQQYFKLSNDKFVIIPEGVIISDFQQTIDFKELNKKYNLPEKFLFYPAQLWKHKNHITILKAMKLLKDKGFNYPLVLTGAKYSAADELFEYSDKFNLNLIYLGKVPYSDLISLYQRAHILILAVLYESSSLLPLEAAAAGLPVIASKTPPNLELGEILSINYFEPLNDSELAGLIAELWDNTETLNKQIQQNKELIPYYSWQNAAKKYLAFFNHILQKNDATTR